MYSDLQRKMESAVAYYRQMRSAQRRKQEESGKTDQGL